MEPEAGGSFQQRINYEPRKRKVNIFTIQVCNRAIIKHVFPVRLSNGSYFLFKLILSWSVVMMHWE